MKSGKAVIKTLDALRRMIVGCQYLSLLSITALILLGFARAAEATFDPLSRQVPQRAWDILVFPSAFLGCVFGTVVGRFLIGRMGRRARSFRLSRWYHPAFMFRDWFVISLLITGLYLALYHGLPSFFPQLGQPQTQLFGWFAIRGSMLLASALVVLIFTDRFRRLPLVQPETILPRGGAQVLALPLIGLLMVGSTVFLGRGLVAFVRGLPDLQGPMAAAAALLGVALTMYAILFALAWVLNQRRPRLRLPIDVRLAMVGTKKVGKTVFLARSYAGLANYKAGKFSIGPTEECRRWINPLNRGMEQGIVDVERGSAVPERVWPPGTVNASNIPFAVKERGSPALQFNWIDVPGGIFENYDDAEYLDQHLDGGPPPWPSHLTPFGAAGVAVSPNEQKFAAEREQFREQLKEANAVVMLFSAEHLGRVGSLEEYPLFKHYEQVVIDFYDLVEDSDREDDYVTVAIIVAQIDLIPDRSARRNIREMMQPLVEHWTEVAQKRGCRRPEVRVFLSSAVSNAVVTPLGPRLPDVQVPLLSENCVEPILWIAAKVLRSQAVIFDDAMGFFVGQSDIHRLAIKLEDAAQ